jgi:hypothetical protein
VTLRLLIGMVPVRHPMPITEHNDEKQMIPSSLQGHGARHRDTKEGQQMNTDNK